LKHSLLNRRVIKLKNNSKVIKGNKPITVYSSNDQWQIDLIDFSKYSRWNSGFKFLLCVVDVISKKGFVSALKSKSQTTQAMKNILAKQKPILIHSDNGTEFLNKSFQELLKSANVRHITVDVGNHRCREKLTVRLHIMTDFSRLDQSDCSICCQKEK
jgi:transposase InsO family protein